MQLAQESNTALIDATVFPREVDLIISALEAGGSGGAESRVLPRFPYRTRAELRLFSDGGGQRPWTLYTRDVNRRGLGFVTSHRLPLGYGGVLNIAAPDGRVLAVNCTLLRCREAAPGWFEGCVYFNRDQADFGALE
ncbi:MAG TPA: hypothetical protein VGN72_19140 [Tepidisphaeraceae bacterium]|nr:hypothetical protein [Tepidisphaeraceae bacterium]